MDKVRLPDEDTIEIESVRSQVYPIRSLVLDQLVCSHPIFGARWSGIQQKGIVLPSIQGTHIIQWATENKYHTVALNEIIFTIPDCSNLQGLNVSSLIGKATHLGFDTSSINQATLREYHLVGLEILKRGVYYYLRFD